MTSLSSIHKQIAISNMRILLGSASSRHTIAGTRTSAAARCISRSSFANAPATTSSTDNEDGVDVVLSSGFLAFSAHCGFLQACDDLDVNIKSIMGTSSGALIGSMYSAGYTPKEIAAEFSRVPPIDRLQPCLTPIRGRGLLSLSPVIRTLRTLIPPTFEQLQGDFACAVVDKNGRHVLVEQGALPEAVAASAAVPFLFARVDVPTLRHGPFIDGGIVCRIGVDLYREKRYGSIDGSKGRPALVHLIGRSSQFSGNDRTDNLGERNIALVESPKTKASLFDLSDFDNQFRLARERALPVLEDFLSQRRQQVYSK